MCGIAGIHHPSPRPVDTAALERMTRSLSHRGPDGEGFHFEAGVGLGHRRLSIIDLAGGAQPLCNEDGSVWVTFNGEIFNYLELRDDLTKRGHVFRTSSDTEVLVHLYEEHGEALVEHLNGQFAFAMWDARHHRLLLARDRVGIRPLFHATLTDGTLLFGSECKALLTHGALKAVIDPVAVGQIASLWAPIPPRTAFVGIEELRPGHLMVVEGERRRLSCYWQHRFPAAHEYENRDEHFWIEHIRETLFEAVRLQLRADVPVAAYLSGGLDSSILAATVKRLHGGSLTTFSVGFADATFDERDYQREMVAQLGTDHHAIDVNAADIGRAFGDVVALAERPLTRTAPAPLLSLSGLVRERGIKVVLTGEGADELFSGYNIFREDKVRRFWARQPDSAWRAALLSRLYGYVKREARMEPFWRQFFRAGLSDTDDPYYSHRIRWKNSAQATRVFAPGIRAQMQSPTAMLDELEATLDPERSRWHPLARAQYLEMTLFLSNYLLSAQGDRVMMGHSVEGRVPFLDHRLIELAARIPPRFKLHGLNEKAILKRAFVDLVPQRIAQRPKQPYRAPIGACFVPGAENLGAQLLDYDAVSSSGWLDTAAVQRLRLSAATPAGLSERDDMALSLAASTQLLHQRYVAS